MAQWSRPGQAEGQRQDQILVYLEREAKSVAGFERRTPGLSATWTMGQFPACPMR